MCVWVSVLQEGERGNLIMAEIKPDLNDLREQSEPTRNLPNRSSHFEQRIHCHYSIGSKHKSAKMTHLIISPISNAKSYFFLLISEKTQEKREQVICVDPEL